MQRVLVVDGLSETEEVLRQVFEPRGLQVQRIRQGHRSDWTDNPTAVPQVIVLNAENVPASTLPAPEWDGIRRVVIGGRIRVPEERAYNIRTVPALFQYGELVSAIECLLQQPAA